MSSHCIQRGKVIAKGAEDDISTTSAPYPNPRTEHKSVLAVLDRLSGTTSSLATSGGQALDLHGHEQARLVRNSGASPSLNGPSRGDASTLGSHQTSHVHRWSGPN